MLDREHVAHYIAAPVFMAHREPESESDWRHFLEAEGCTAWLVESPAGPVGFMRFGREFEASAVVESESGVFISGAYIRTSERGRGAATAMLDAGLTYYAAIGFTTCAVDFESFNPEASAFWPRYFTPACLTLMRIPESTT
jgi:GNAT superfamily N-acetyltransferase